MKLPKVTKKLVTQYSSGCRGSHDEEGTAICKDWKRLKKLEKYAAHRYDCNVMSCIPCTTGGCTCGFDSIKATA